MPRRDESFATYVAQRRAQLFRIAWLLSGDPHRAEDVVQAALARLYVAWPRVRRADSVEAYVRRAILNAHLDEARRPWRREAAAGDRLPEGRVEDPDVEVRDELWAALRALPEGQRKVVVLRHWWGLSVEETAADLGVSAGTVKSQTSVALAALRRALADNLEKENT